MRVDVLPGTSQENSLTLAHVFWLDDEYWLFLLIGRLVGLGGARYLILADICILLNFEASVDLDLLIFAILDSRRAEDAFEVVELVGKQIRLRKEIIIGLELLFHQHQIFAKFIFVGDHLYAWPLRDSLVRLYTIQDVRRDS